jgi:probable HAF family extracellular repeat protein
MKRRLAKGMIAFLCLAAALPATMARADLVFTTIDPPGSDGGALGFGINNAGQVVGTSLDAGFNATGFVYSAGNFTFLAVPGAAGGSDANAINNKGDIAGDYNDADGFAHGFLRQGGVFSTLNSTPYGLNDGGMVVGSFIGGTGHPTGYVLFNGVSTPIAVPGALETYAYGINNRGDVVGASDIPGTSSGFLLRDGVLTSFRAPGASFTEAHGINNAGTIVGFSNDGNQASGFVLSGGVFTTIRVPGALDTAVYGINDAGTLVGFYDGADGGLHAFIATAVPEPSSALLAGMALPLIVAWARGRWTGRNA